MKKLKQYENRLISFLTGLVVIFISLYALFYSGLSFDGAFHSQAAINFYKHGKYVLDYPIGFTQIKVPFQLVNGFFLTLFGTNFISANLANVLFYALFAGLFYKLHKRFDSSLILIAFILTSFSSGLIDFGFKGYGELSVLVYGLLGLLLIIYGSNSKSKLFFGGFFIGTALATKWIFVLILPPFGLLLFSLFITKKYKLIINSLLGFLLSLIVFWGIEYYNYSVDIVQLFREILLHSKPVNNLYYSDYAQRISLFWKVYLQYSGGLFLAIIKIIAYLQLLFLVFSLSVKAIRLIKKSKTLSENQLFILIIGVFALEYFIWWFFISSKPWFRRGFIADILLFIAISLAVKELPVKDTFQKAFKYLASSVLIILVIFNIFYFFSNHSEQLLSDDDKGSVILESHLRMGLDKLPDDYIACGYDWWQSPRWSFLSGVKHQDIFSFSLEEKMKMKNDSDKYFVFFEPVNYYDMASYHRIHEMYKLSTIFEYNKYSIKQIISKKNTSKNLSLINYLDYDYNKTSGVYKREKDFCWYSQDAEILLDATNKNRFILTYFIPNINSYSSPPSLSIFFNNELVYKKQISSSGTASIKFKVPNKYKQNRVVVNIKVSSSVNAKADSRNLGIPIRKIGFN